MKSAFNLDSPFFRLMSRIGDIFLLNLIFVITCIPIVTIGAAVTALMTIEIKMTTNKEGYIISGYWKAFRRNFKQATIIHLLLGGIGLLLLFDLNFWVNLETNGSNLMIVVSIIPIILYSMIMIYVYVQQAIFENRIIATIKNSLLMAIKYLPITILLAISMVAVVCVMYMFSIVRIFMLLFGFGLLGYAFSVVYRFVYREYLDEPEDDDIEETDIEETDIEKGNIEESNREEKNKG